MKLKDLLDLLDPMTPLRIVPLCEKCDYLTVPAAIWSRPDIHREDLCRTVIKLDPETIWEKPGLMIGLETEKYIKDQERIDKKFRSGDWVERCPDFHADKDGRMVPDWETD